MQSVYLLLEDNKDNPVIPASYPITIQNTDGSHRSNSALQVQIKSRAIWLLLKLHSSLHRYVYVEGCCDTEEAAALYKHGMI